MVCQADPVAELICAGSICVRQAVECQFFLCLSELKDVTTACLAIVLDTHSGTTTVFRVLKMELVVSTVVRCDVIRCEVPIPVKI